MAVASTRASLARVPHALGPGQHYHTAGGELVVVLLLVLLVMAEGGVDGACTSPIDRGALRWGQASRTQTTSFPEAR